MKRKCPITKPPCRVVPDFESSLLQPFEAAEFKGNAASDFIIVRLGSRDGVMEL